MYLLASQLRGEILDSKTPDKVFMPELWSTSIEHLNTAQKAANAIFLNKQIAFIIKHYNNLTDEWAVIPLQNYLNLKKYVDAKEAAIFSQQRFAFVLAVHNGLKNVSVFSNTASFDELLSGQDFVTTICKRFPPVSKLIELDKQSSYEEAEEKAKKFIVDFKDSNEF